MKINFLWLLALILFITGCTISTTGNIVIEEGIDESGNVIIEEVPEEPVETEEAEEPLEEEVPEEEAEEAEESETTTKEAEEAEETTKTPEIIGTVINIENLEFNPETLTIKKGEAVTWVHKDKYIKNMKHMVRIYPGGDASSIMLYGDVFSYTFDEAGEYTIIDVIYTKKNVKGKIIVE